MKIQLSKLFRIHQYQFEGGGVLFCSFFRWNWFKCVGRADLGVLLPPDISKTVKNSENGVVLLN